MMAEQITAPHARFVLNRHIVVGVLMIVVGVALFIAQRSELDINWWSTWWALVLLFMGIVRLISPGVENGRPQSRRTGLWLAGVGMWGFVSQARLFGFDYSNSWPLLIIIAGINFVWRALEQRSDVARTALQESR